jgi:hypothetical protein
MSSIVISGDTSGTVTVAVPAVAGTNTVTIAAQTGTLNAAGPAFGAYANATQTVTLATQTKIAIDTEFFDTNSCFDTTLNRFTPTVAGYYQVNGILRGSVATVFSGIALLLYKNGVIFRRGGEINGTLTAGQACQVTFSEVIYLNGTTDYLEFYGLLTGTGTATFASSGNLIAGSAFSASLVRGA